MDEKMSTVTVDNPKTESTTYFNDNMISGSTIEIPPGVSEPDISDDFLNDLPRTPNRRIYIAGPISNGGKLTPRGQYKAVKEAQKYYEALIRTGWTPILPHLSYYAWLDFEEDVHWPRWIEMDLDHLDSVICVIRMPGDSKGADMEVKYAREHGIPVIKAQSPRHMTAEIEMKFGVPPERKELQKYIDMIKRDKEDHNA